MQVSRFRIALAPLALSLAFAAQASAQESELFTWSGRVDRDVRLSVRGGGATNTYESSIQSRARFRMSSALPQREGTLRVVTNRGRGSVSVLQQPTASNGYEAIIDVRDDEGGADNYQVTAYWSPLNGDARGNRGNGRGYGYGNQRRDERRDEREARREERDDRRGDDRRDDRRDDRSNGRYGNNSAPTLSWSGDVDSVVELIWRGGTVNQRLVNGAQVRNVNASVGGSQTLNTSGVVDVQVRQGRGRVEVIQQPTAQNRYTTIVRITDPQGGYGRYDLQATLR